MSLDSWKILVGFFSLLVGVQVLHDASRYLRHSGPWTRRMRMGIGTICSGLTLMSIDHGSPVGWLMLFTVMLVASWPDRGSLPRSERDESVALRRLRVTTGTRGREGPWPE